jgi:hypothetical protein
MEQRAFNASTPAGLVRPRLLIEDPDQALQVSDFRLFEEAGLAVALCQGPGPSDSCPLMAEGRCRLAEEGDVVLIGPGVGPFGAELAAAHQQSRPGLPVVVAVRRDDGEVPPPGCVSLTVPASVTGQIRTVWRALERSGARRPPEPPSTPPPSAAESATLARLVDLLGW